jgi:hypothetical protein
MEEIVHNFTLRETLFEYYVEFTKSLKRCITLGLGLHLDDFRMIYYISFIIETFGGLSNMQTPRVGWKEAEHLSNVMMNY